MDWFRQGQIAATSGSSLRKARTYFVGKCQEDHGVAIDSVAFGRGFKSGLNLMCTPEGLKELAAKGIKYQDTCENLSESSPVEAAVREKELADKVRDLEKEVSRLTRENLELKERLKAFETSSEERDEQ
jgi:hypothetical protein